MKVLLTLWITAVLVQEVVPSSLVRLPRHSDKRPQSTVHTEYVAQYEQKGSKGNGSYSTVKGRQEIVHDSCGDNWNNFAEKCAGLIKDLIASLANAVSSQPGDATNLQLHIKNSFKHFDSTHNCSCFNQTCKGLSDLDLSSLFKNITVETAPLRHPCEDYYKSLDDDKSGDGPSGQNNRPLGSNQPGFNIEDEDSGTDPTNKNNRQTNDPYSGSGNKAKPTGSSEDPFQGNYSPPPLPVVNHGRGGFPDGIKPGPNQPPFEYSAVSVSPPYNTKPSVVANNYPTGSTPVPNNYNALPAIPDSLPAYPSPPPVAKRPYPLPISPSQPENQDSENCDSDEPQSGQPDQGSTPGIVPVESSGQLGQPNIGQGPPVILPATPAPVVDPNYPPPIDSQLGQPNYPPPVDGPLGQPIGQDPLYPGLITSPPPFIPQVTSGPSNYPSPVDGNLGQPNYPPPVEGQLGQPNAGPSPQDPIGEPLLPPSLGPAIPNSPPSDNQQSTSSEDCDDSESGSTPTGPGSPAANTGNLPSDQNLVTPPPTVVPVYPPTSADQTGSPNNEDSDCSDSDSGPVTPPPTFAPAYPPIDGQLGAPNVLGPDAVPPSPQTDSMSPPATLPQAGGHPNPPPTVVPVYPPTSDDQTGSPNDQESDCSDSESTPEDGSGTPTVLPYYPPPTNGQLGSPNVPIDPTGGPGSGPTEYPTNGLPVTPPPTVVPVYPPTSDDQTGSPSDQDSDCSDSESTPQDGSGTPTVLPYYPPPANGQLGSPNAPVDPTGSAGSGPSGYPTIGLPVTPPPTVVPVYPPASDDQTGSPSDQDSDCSDSESTPQEGSETPTVLPYNPSPMDGQLGSPNTPLDSAGGPGGYPTNGLPGTPPPVVAPVYPPTSDDQTGSPNDQESDCSDSESTPEDEKGTPTVVPYYPSPADGQSGSPNVPLGPTGGPGTGPSGYPTNGLPVTPPPTVVPVYPPTSGDQTGSPNNEDSDCSDSDDGNGTPTSSDPLASGPSAGPTKDGGYPVTAPPTLVPSYPPAVPVNPTPVGPAVPVTPPPVVVPVSPSDDSSSSVNDQDSNCSDSPQDGNETPTVIPYYPPPSNGQLGSPNTPVALDPTSGGYPTNPVPVTSPPTVVPYPPASGQLGQPNVRNTYVPLTPVTTPSPSGDDCEDESTTQPPSIIPSNQSPLIPVPTSPPSYPGPASGQLGQPNVRSKTSPPPPVVPASPAIVPTPVTPPPLVAPSFPPESNGQLGQPGSSPVTPVVPVVPADPVIPVATPVGSGTTPAQPFNGYPNEGFPQPTTFQTTSIEPTPPQITTYPSSPKTKPILPPSPSYPTDSDESFPQRPSTSPSHSYPTNPSSLDSDDEDDEEDCCTCESCTEEDDMKSPQQIRTSACKDLEEARRELKAIFDKIKKKLKCGKRANTISSTPPL